MKLTIKDKFDYKSYLACYFLIKTAHKEYSIYDNHENIILEMIFATGTIYDFENKEQIIFSERNGILFFENNYATIVLY